MAGVRIQALALGGKPPLPNLLGYKARLPGEHAAAGRGGGRRASARLPRPGVRPDVSAQRVMSKCFPHSLSCRNACCILKAAACCATAHALGSWGHVISFHPFELESTSIDAPCVKVLPVGGRSCAQPAHAVGCRACRRTRVYAYPPLARLHRRRQYRRSMGAAKIVCACLRRNGSCGGRIATQTTLRTLPRSTTTGACVACMSS